MKQDVDWAGNRVAQLKSHVQDVEDSENDDGLRDNENENQDDHDDTNNDDDDDDGKAVGSVCHKCKVIR